MTRLGFLFSIAIGLAFGGLGCDRSTPVPKPNVAPKAEFNFNPVSPIYAGQTVVRFNTTGSIDADGQIVKYLWNFGDSGTTAQQDLGPTPTHIFTDTSATCLLKTYSVLLTVIDNEGAQDSIAHDVTVTELPAPGSPACKQ